MTGSGNQTVYRIMAFALGWCMIILLPLLAGGQRPLRTYRGAVPNPPKKVLVQPAPVVYNADSAFQKLVWVSPSGDSMRYRMLLPEGYTPGEKYPLLLFLHGAGERGNDNKSQLRHGAQLFLQPDNRQDFPAIVLFPQCPSGDFWSNVQITTDSAGKWAFTFLPEGTPTPAMRLLMQWLDAMEPALQWDTARAYVMGLSMGGMGAYELVRRKQDYFAAAVPICGGAHPATALAMRKTSFWAFHGQIDNVVPWQFSREIIMALQEFMDKNEARITLYPNTNHNSWDPAFADKDLLPWLFSRKRKAL